MNTWIKENIKIIQESQSADELAAKESPRFIEAYLKEMQTDPEFTCETYNVSFRITLNNCFIFS